MLSIADIHAARDGLRPFSDIPWVARDDSGELAVLTSAGFGQIPMQMFTDARRYLSIIPELERAYDEQTVYLYDYGGQCQLVRTVPYTRDFMPDQCADLELGGFQVPRFNNVHFRDTEELLIDQYFGQTNE